MRITYYIEDGYVGNRPQHVDIPDEELKDLGEDASIEEYINDVVQEHFEQNISLYWDKKQIDGFK